MLKRRLIAPVKKGRKELILSAVRPNEGLRIAYRRKLEALVTTMQNDIEKQVLSAYEGTPPQMAVDDSLSSTLLISIMDKLRKKWTQRFNDASQDLAEYYATDMADRADGALEAILRRGGFSVKFKMTRAMQDVMKSTIAEQVGLIRSIGEKHLSDVQGLVMRSVSAGRDLNYLSTELRKRFGVTKKRAAFIAHDQNSKATAKITRARQTELGITEAVWLHSHGGKTPRRTHLANNNKRYNIEKGWYDPDEGEYIWPGELINCRCVSKSIVRGFD